MSGNDVLDCNTCGGKAHHVLVFGDDQLCDACSWKEIARLRDALADVALLRHDLDVATKTLREIEVRGWASDRCYSQELARMALAELGVPLWQATRLDEITAKLKKAMEEPK